MFVFSFEYLLFLYYELYDDENERSFFYLVLKALEKHFEKPFVKKILLQFTNIHIHRLIYNIFIFVYMYLYFIFKASNLSHCRQYIRFLYTGTISSFAVLACLLPLRCAPLERVRLSKIGLEV